jgi:hypothetical protein
MLPQCGDLSPVAFTPTPGRHLDPAPLVVAPLQPHCRATVIIPARDESSGIVATLEALVAQRGRNGQLLDPRTYDLLVLANNCADDTAAVVRDFALRHPQRAIAVTERALPPGAANVGTARRLLMESASQRFRHAGRPRGVIVSLDADTIPESGWLAATLAAIDAGADAVGGRIQTDAAGRAALPEGARVAHLRDVGYRTLVDEVESLIDPLSFDPWPRHYQHFGASLALTAEAYEAVGGLAPLPALEDVALAIALVAADARVRHDPAVRVITSARTVARNVRGFSTQFQEWEVQHRAGEAIMVESAASVVARARRRAGLRALWRGLRGAHGDAHGMALALATEYRLSADGLLRMATLAPTFGQFEFALARREGRRLPFDPLGPPQPIEAATRELRYLLADLRQSGAHASAARQEIEPIRLRPLSGEMVETIVAMVQEFLMDLVAVQRRVADRRGPMDQQEVAAAG